MEKTILKLSQPIQKACVWYNIHSCLDKNAGKPIKIVAHPNKANGLLILILIHDKKRDTIKLKVERYNYYIKEKIKYQDIQILLNYVNDLIKKKAETIGVKNNGYETTT